MHQLQEMELLGTSGARFNDLPYYNSVIEQIMSVIDHHSLEVPILSFDTFTAGLNLTFAPQASGPVW